jgi:hypothetical protein
MKEESKVLVAKIISYEKIVINKGTSDGIDDNMEFLVYNDGSEVKDPGTGNSLGVLENPKGFFKVFHIQEKMTTLISKYNKPNPLFNITPFTEDPEIQALKSIKIGDKVKIINQLKNIDG